MRVAQRGKLKARFFYNIFLKLKLRHYLVLVPASKKGSGKSQDAFKKSPGNFALVKYLDFLFPERSGSISPGNFGLALGTFQNFLGQ